MKYVKKMPSTDREQPHYNQGDAAHLLILINTLKFVS